MTDLSVNLNKIALIRNSRSGNYPDVIAHAATCITAGAHGITVHPRPDQRHIRPTDVTRLHQLIKKYNTENNASIEFNIEGNPFAEASAYPAGHYPGFISLVLNSPPHQCTLVPDSNDQLTSDHGFDLKKSGKKLSPVIQDLKRAQIRVSLFMDPDLEQISIAADLGADRIELYTGPFAECYLKNPDSHETNTLFAQHCKAAEHACRLGLGVNAGHDLNLQNLRLYRTLPHLNEVSIGHALIVDAIHSGLTSTVQTYLKTLNPA